MGFGNRSVLFNNCWECDVDTYKLVDKYVRSKVDVDPEDVVMDTIADIFEEHGDIDEVREDIAIRMAKDRIYQRVARDKRDDKGAFHDEPKGWDDVVDVIFTDQQLARLRMVVDGLGKDIADTYYLIYVDGLSILEAAESLGVCRRTISYRINRIKQEVASHDLHLYL